MSKPLTAADAYAAELSHRHAVRAFSPPLEAEYLEYKDERSVLLLRFGCSVAVLLYGAFFIIDLVNLQRLTEPWLFVMCFGVASPATVTPALATLHPRWRHRARQLVPWTTAINAAALITGIIWARLAGKALPYEILVISLMYAYFLGGLLARVAIPLAAAVVAAYLVAEGLAGLPASELWDRGFVLTSTALLGAITCLLLEYSERRGWLRSRMVEEMALHDALTGLYNRRHLYAAGDVLLRDAARNRVGVGVLVVDIDHFKAFNDERGHLAGDGCLQQVALAVRQAAVNRRDIAARFGGEEFVLLIYDVDHAEVAEAAERLRRAVEALNLDHPDPVCLRVSVSIGWVARIPAGDSESLSELIADADAALYRAKAAGRNRVSGPDVASVTP